MVATAVTAGMVATAGMAATAAEAADDRAVGRVVRCPFGMCLARISEISLEIGYELRLWWWSRLGSNQSPRRANALIGPAAQAGWRADSGEVRLVGAAVGDRVERVHVGFVRLACALTDQFTWSSCFPIRLSKTTSDLHRNWCAILGLNQMMH